MNAPRNDVTMEINLLLFVIARSVVKCSGEVKREGDEAISRLEEGTKWKRLPRRKGVFY